MNTDLTGGKKLDPAFVRSQLDEILAEEITSFFDLDADLVMLSYNLATISCLLIAVEREREINEFADSPPERYTRQTYIEELVDIGLEHDDLDAAVDAVMEKGYISMSDSGEIQAQISAFTTVGFLNTMFPGMQGMHLIAFVLQMNDEVLSGRKNLEEAKNSFRQTLKTRGVKISKAEVQAAAPESSAGTGGAVFQKNRRVSRELKETAVKRLKKLKLKSGAGPASYSSDGMVLGQSKVKSLFDKGEDKKALAAREKIREEKEEAARLAAQKEKELAQREAKLKEAEDAARRAQEKALELEARERELAAAEEASRKAAEAAQELKEKEALIAAREAQLKAREAQLKLEEEQRLREAEESPKQDEAAVDGDLDIESKIAAFEAELAMPCPLCHEGRVVTATTAKNKEYYTCTNKACRFVSWDKPCHFSCPLCKNPFLTEFVLPTGEVGLKCPRATCSYQQKGIMDPVVTLAAHKENNAPKKKRKVVRRVKKRR